MKRQLLNGVLLAGTLALGTTAFSETAEAFDLKQCAVPGTYSAIVSRCQYVEPDSDQGNDLAADPSVFSTQGPPGATTVNVNNVNFQAEGGVESFFGTSTWKQIAKVDTSFGTQDLSSFWAANTSIMAIWKGGQNSTIVGYEIIPNTASFSFTEAFNPWEGIVDNASNVSHVTFYGNQQPIPTPAAVLPGLMGMGAAAFRKKQQGQEEAEA